MKNWYYEIRFADGRYTRREYVTKKLAQSVYETMLAEMNLLNVKEVSWGVM